MAPYFILTILTVAFIATIVIEDYLEKRSKGK